MPAFALGWYFAAAHMRLTRSAMIDVLGTEYIKLARLKGLPEALVIAKHAFKNALIPVITLAGINLVIMVNVAIVVETVFAWPGIGRLLYEGITFRDFPVVQGIVIIGGAMIVLVNLLVDILYALIDPRIRLKVTAMGVPAVITLPPPGRSTATRAMARWLPGHSRRSCVPLRWLQSSPTSLLRAIQIGSLAARFKPPSWESGGTANIFSAPTSSDAMCCRGLSSGPGCR
jgi:hypothetical protein